MHSVYTPCESHTHILYNAHCTYTYYPIHTLYKQDATYDVMLLCNNDDDVYNSGGQ